jgi:hypothetical protein
MHHWNPAGFQKVNGSIYHVYGCLFCWHLISDHFSDDSELVWRGREN